MKEILLKLQDDDYQRLEWVSEKLGLSISKCLRSLIPGVALPETKMVAEEREIAAANSNDLVPVARELGEDNLKELTTILSELRERKWAAILANEIYRQIVENGADRKCLTVGTYRRLSRWVTPYRWSAREQFVKPRAQRISEILFGRPISRID